MAKDWIHRKNSDFNDQALNFANRIVAESAAYGIDPAEAAQLAAEQVDYAAKYQTASQPGSRTSVAVIARDDARKVLANHMRSIGARVRANPVVTDEMRILLSLTVPGQAPAAPDGPPKTRPRINVLSLDGNHLTLRVRDTESASPAKPRHYLGAQIYICTDSTEQAPADLNRWRLATVTTKGKTLVKLPFIEPGTRVWLCARWFNTHGAGAVSNIAYVWTGGMVVAPSLAAA